MSKRRNKNKKAGPVKIIRPADLLPPVDAAGSVEQPVEELAVAPLADEAMEAPAAMDEIQAAEAAEDASEAAAVDAGAVSDESGAAEVPAADEAVAAEVSASEEVSGSGASPSDEPASEVAFAEPEHHEAPAVEAVEPLHEFEDASALLAQSVEVEPVAGQAAKAIESIQFPDEHAMPADAEAAPAVEEAADVPAPQGRNRKHDRKLKLNKLQKHARSEPEPQPEAAPAEPEPEPAAPEPEPERRGPSEPRIAAFTKLAEYQTLSLAHVAGLPEESDVPGHWRGVGFGISGRLFVAGFDEVVEVIRMPQITHVPGTQPWMLGVANVRGTLLPVVDLKQFLEGERTVMYEGQRVMVVRQSGGNVAVLIDQLFGQRAFNDSQKVPAVTNADGRFGYFIKQVYRVGDNDWGVFSMLTLTRTPEFRQAAV